MSMSVQEAGVRCAPEEEENHDEKVRKRKSAVLMRRELKSVMSARAISVEAGVWALSVSSLARYGDSFLRHRAWC